MLKMNVLGSFAARNVKNTLGDHVLTKNGLFSRVAYDHSKNQPMKLLPAPSYHSDMTLTLKHNRVESVLSAVNKLVKRKLSLGAKILQLGGIDKVFRRLFSVKEEEQLLRAFRCCLSTTAGPIPGRLFVSSEKLAFCSDRPIAKVTTPSGETQRFHYKIVVPLRQIKRTAQSKNIKKPTQKYIQVVTKDDFEFWFMGILNYKKTIKFLQQALSQGLIC